MHAGTFFRVFTRTLNSPSRLVLSRAASAPLARLSCAAASLAALSSSLWALGWLGCEGAVLGPEPAGRPLLPRPPRLLLLVLCPAPCVPSLPAVAVLPAAGAAVAAPALCCSPSPSSSPAPPGVAAGAVGEPAPPASGSWVRCMALPELGASMSPSPGLGVPKRNCSGLPGSVERGDHSWASPCRSVGGEAASAGGGGGEASPAPSALLLGGRSCRSSAKPASTSSGAGGGEPPGVVLPCSAW